jgi:hypothetical protein
MMRTMCSGLLLAMVLLGLAPLALAQDGVAYLEADRDSVLVGEPFALTLVVPHGMAAEVVWPQPGRPWAGGEVEVLEQVATDVAYGGSDQPGVRIDRATYRVAAFALDTLRIGPVGVQLVADGDTFVVASQPFELPMRHVLPDSASLFGPHDLRGIGFPAWVWLTLIAALAALAALIWWWRKRTRDHPDEPAAPARIVPPDERARTLLEQARALDLNDPAQIKPFYVLVTDAVRGYLSERAGVPTLERTSAEVVREARAAARAGRVPADSPDLLAELFAVADYAKYADGRPSPAKGADALDAARTLVEQTEAHLAPAERSETDDEDDAPPPAPLPSPDSVAQHRADLDALNRPRPAPAPKPAPPSYAPPGARPPGWSPIDSPPPADDSSS